MTARPAATCYVRCARYVLATLGSIYKLLVGSARPPQHVFKPKCCGGCSPPNTFSSLIMNLFKFLSYPQIESPATARPVVTCYVRCTRVVCAHRDSVWGPLEMHPLAIRFQAYVVRQPIIIQHIIKQPNPIILLTYYRTTNQRPITIQ